MSIEDISFIIQGQIQPHINQQIAEIKQYFPQAEVIVSSCNKIDYEIEGADKIISSPDPGFFYYSKLPGIRKNNINRQIVSTLAGLQQATRQYVFKLRSDFWLTGKDFLRYWDEQPLRKDEFTIFKHKVIACCYCTRNPHDKTYPYPFHPSDVAFFGLKEDALKLFTIPLMTEKDAYWDEKRDFFNRYMPEQYIFYHCLKNCGQNVHLDSYQGASPENIAQTESYFFSNFVFINYKKFNLLPTKPNFFCKNEIENFATCYTTLEAKKNYMKIIEDKNYKYIFDAERFEINYFLAVLKCCRGLARAVFLFIPVRQIRKKYRPKLAEALYKFITFSN